MATAEQRVEEALLRINRWMGNYATNRAALVKAKTEAEKGGYLSVATSYQVKIDHLNARIYDLDDLRKTLVGDEDSYIEGKAPKPLQDIFAEADAIEQDLATVDDES